MTGVMLVLFSNHMLLLSSVSIKMKTHELQYNIPLALVLRHLRSNTCEIAFTARSQSVSATAPALAAGYGVYESSISEYAIKYRVSSSALPVHHGCTAEHCSNSTKHTTTAEVLACKVPEPHHSIGLLTVGRPRTTRVTAYQAAGDTQKMFKGLLIRVKKATNIHNSPTHVAGLQTRPL